MKKLNFEFNDLESFIHIRSGIASYLQTLFPSNYTLVEIAFNEAVNNALKHCKKDGDSFVTVTLKIQNDKRLLIRITDEGSGFDVIKTYENIEKNYHEPSSGLLMEESGRGLMIMDFVMDKVIYNRKGNEVLLVKELQMPIS